MRSKRSIKINNEFNEFIWNGFFPEFELKSEQLYPCFHMYPQFHPLLHQFHNFCQLKC